MLRRVDRVVEPVLAAILLTIVLVLFLGVVFRYAINRPLSWVEEVARFELVWLTFLGAYVAFRRRAHMRIGVVVERMSARARARLSVVGNLLMALVIALLIREGVRYTAAFFSDPSPYLRFPIGLQYLALPLGGILWLLALVAATKAIISRSPEEEAPTATRPPLDSE